MKFELQHTDSKTKARVGSLHTDHGEIETPIFMPVGTVASVKAMPQQTLLNDTKAKIILGNTYHLYLRPGLDTLEKAGGLHKFMNWSKPILNRIRTSIKILLVFMLFSFQKLLRLFAFLYLFFLLNLEEHFQGRLQ